jgi:hypothetical protein
MPWHGISGSPVRLSSKQTTIDRFVARYGCRADLIKIDTTPQKKLAESGLV